MDAILVANAGSSSLKFQIFAVAGDKIERRVRGQVDGIGVRPRLRAADGDGATLVDRSYEPAEVHDLPAAIATTRAWLASLEGFAFRAIGHRVVHGGPEFDRPVRIDEAVLDRLARYQSLAPPAPAEQPSRSNSPGDEDRPAGAAGRLLRHCLPPRPPGPRRLLRDAATPFLRRGHPSLRLPWPQLRSIVADRLPHVAPGDRRRPCHRRTGS